MRKVSDYIIKFLAQKKTDYIFGYIGGAVTHIIDSIYTQKKVKFIQVYHEQTAVFAAEGYSRNSENKVGVAIATSGPGATNLITGIADAYFDSIPLICITGQVNTYEYKYKKPVRQQGFQETDIVNIVKPITKYAKLIDKPEMIKYELEKAFHIALEGRPGPVVLDIPMDIQRSEIIEKELKSFFVETKLQEKEIVFDQQKIIKIISNSKYPLVLAGGGAQVDKAKKELQKFAIKNNIPVVSSLMGKGAFPEDHELFLGMIGTYGNRCANIALANTDLLIVIGSRLDTRQTGTSIKDFLKKGRIIHIDIDKNELKYNRIKRRICILGKAEDVLEKFNLFSLNYNSLKWLNYIKNLKNNYNQEKEVLFNCSNLIPYKLMEILNKYGKKDHIYTVDIGQNQMFAAQALKLIKEQKFFTSGGMAPMGYAIPVAIGASFACENQKPITAIAGDGGFHISLQALMLISQYQLPIKVVVINNKTLGMIVQFQDLYFEEREVATTDKSGYLVPNIKDIAAAYNLKYFFLNKNDMNNIKKIEKVFKFNKPAIIEVYSEDKTTVVPRLEVNNQIENMSPKLTPKALKNIMLCID